MSLRDVKTELSLRLVEAEKSNYLFRNYRGCTSGRALFMGCMFPSVYPRTADLLVELLKEYDVGVIHDCCGQPLADLGLVKQETKAREGLEVRLADQGVEQLIVVCPHCYTYFKQHLSVPVVSVYAVLEEFELGQPISTKGEIFVPCPDRDSLGILRTMESFLPDDQPQLSGVPCCGYGGNVSIKEPERARAMAQCVLSSAEETVLTYCASCSHSLASAGLDKQVSHCLTEILGVNEKPATRRSLYNRAMTRFK